MAEAGIGADREPEHGRRTLPRWRPDGRRWPVWRVGRPLIGGAAGMAIVVAFLAIRGGEAGGPVDTLTGTQRGGWNRPEDVHLLLVISGAGLAGLALGVLAEYVRHWFALAGLAAAGGTLLALRELASLGPTAADVLLGLVLGCAALAGATMLFDALHSRRRSGS